MRTSRRCQACKRLAPEALNPTEYRKHLASSSARTTSGARAPVPLRSGWASREWRCLPRRVTTSTAARHTFACSWGGEGPDRFRERGTDEVLTERMRGPVDGRIVLEPAEMDVVANPLLGVGEVDARFCLVARLLEAAELLLSPTEPVFRVLQLVGEVCILAPECAELRDQLRIRLGGLKPPRFRLVAGLDQAKRAHRHQGGGFR